MSNTDKVSSDSGEESHDKPSLNPQRITRMMEDFEIFAMQRGGQNTFDISRFTPEQIEKLFDLMQTNEQNAFKYHMKRLDVFENVQTKKIETGIFNQKTLRYIAIGVLAAVVVTTFFILFYYKEFFTTWLTILFSVFGGAGISVVIRPLIKQPKVKNNLPDEADE